MKYENIRQILWQYLSNGLFAIYFSNLMLKKAITVTLLHLNLVVFLCPHLFLLNDINSLLNTVKVNDEYLGCVSHYILTNSP